MSAIEKFFEKKKLDVKFKKAGDGKRLTVESEASTSANAGKIRHQNEIKTDDLTREKKRAADAALARLNQAKQESSGPTKKYGQTIKSEMIAEKRLAEERIKEEYKRKQQLIDPIGKPTRLENSPVVDSVLFTCGLLGDEVILPRRQMEEKIEEFLLQQVQLEALMTSALMIHSLNKNKDAIRVCVETLSKYITNIVDHPGKEMYRNIKLSNKVLKEKVLAVRGAEEFLQAVGFVKKGKMAAANENPNPTEEEYLILEHTDENGKEESESKTTEYLRSCLEILQMADPIKIEIYRDRKVFRPTNSTERDVRINVPDEFYALSKEEIKREQEAKEEIVGQLNVLRTKEMRERNRLKNLRYYRYCIVRIRFPDGYLLQGTFEARETFSSLRQFVSQSLQNEWCPFILSTNWGVNLNGVGLRSTTTNDSSTNEEVDDRSLVELNLAPASLLLFSWDPAFLDECMKTNVDGLDGSGSPRLQDFNVYLKKELIAKAQSL